MTGFSDIPKELVVQIWQHVLDPEAVENFAIASKTIYALGGPFIAEHNELKAQFSAIVHNNYEEGSGPAETLKSILLKPRAALYVRDLFVDGWRNGWVDLKHHTPYPGATVELFKQSVIESPLILEDEVERWLDILRAGDEVAVYSLMLTKLPNVRAISLTWRTLAPDLLFHTLEAIARSRDTEALSRLVKVRLGPYETSFKWVLIFATLPSVKVIEAWGISFSCDCPNHHDPDRCSCDCHGYERQPGCDYAAHHDQTILRPRTSAVSHLAFNGCNMNMKRICGYLEGLRALKSFEWLSVLPIDEEFEPMAIVNALLAQAKSTLQRLHLTPSFYGRKRECTLVGFEVMKELGIDYNFLLGHRPSGICKLVDVLPTSIEKVRLKALRTEDYDTAKHHVLEIIQQKVKGLPNLKVFTIELSQMDINFIAHMVTLKNKCEAAGIVFQVTMSSGEFRKDFFRTPVDEF